MSVQADEKIRYQELPRGRVRPCGGATCGRVIRLVQLENGNWLPIDPEPQPEGRVVVLADGRGRVLKADELELVRRTGQPLYNSHFVTCPDGPAFRRRGLAQGRSTRRSRQP